MSRQYQQSEDDGLCFELIGFLGEGFYGKVGLYKTPVGEPYYDEHKSVVIKEMRKTNEAAWNEANIMQATSHPNIVQFFHQFLNQAGSLCIVMQFCNFGTLLHSVSKTPRDERNVWNFVQQISAALAYLHERDPPIQHRDVKPDNILGAVTRIQQVDCITWKLADFGSACVLDWSDACGYHSRSAHGEIAYMAPEVLLNCGKNGRNEPYGTPADVWNLGTLMFFYCNHRDMFANGNEVRAWPGGKSSLSSQHYMAELRNMQALMLDPVPANRPTAASIYEKCCEM